MHSGLLSVVFAAAVTATLGQYHCREVAWGTKEGEPLEEQTVYLSAGIRDWAIDIPMIPPCTQVHGVSTTVCDYDVVPESHYKDSDHLLVHRKGELHGQASVKATVYCDQ